MNGAQRRLLVAGAAIWACASMCLVISAPTHGHLVSMVVSVIALVVAHKLDDSPPATPI